MYFKKGSTEENSSYLCDLFVWILLNGIANIFINSAHIAATALICIFSGNFNNCL